MRQTAAVFTPLPHSSDASPLPSLGLTDLRQHVETYISHCGRFEVKGDRVCHHIQASLFPNWTGVTQERIVSLTGDTLRLSTPPLLIKGKEQAVLLVRKRARRASRASRGT